MRSAVGCTIMAATPAARHAIHGVATHRILTTTHPPTVVLAPGRRYKRTAMRVTVTNHQTMHQTSRTIETHLLIGETDRYLDG
jgi:hypothetical protein